MNEMRRHERALALALDQIEPRRHRKQVDEMAHEVGQIELAMGAASDRHEGGRVDGVLAGERENECETVRGNVQLVDRFGGFRE
jgi:hypothetical protein